MVETISLIVLTLLSLGFLERQFEKRSLQQDEERNRLW